MEPKMPTPEELQKKRDESDEKLIAGGAEHVVDKGGNKRLSVTEEQWKTAFEKMITQKNMEFFNENRNEDPTPLLVMAIENMSEKGEAIDLGAGSFVDARYMIDQGFEHVTAIDELPNDKFLKDEDRENITFIQTGVEDYEFPIERFNLLNAASVLSYVEKDKISSVVEGLKKSLKKEGVFAGIFFGPDDWRTKELERTTSSFDKKEIQDLFSDFDDVNIKEYSKERKNKKGLDVLEHGFRVIAQK